MSEITVLHHAPGRSPIKRYIPEKVFDIALGILPKNERYEIISGGVDLEVELPDIRENLEKMEINELKFRAVELGIKLGATKDREKIIQKILDANI